MPQRTLFERVFTAILAVFAGTFLFGAGFACLVRILIPSYGNQIISTREWVSVFGGFAIYFLFLLVALLRRWYAFSIILVLVLVALSLLRGELSSWPEMAIILFIGLGLVLCLVRFRQRARGADELAEDEEQGEAV